MKVIVLTGYGDVDKLEVREVSDPTTGPNEIKIRMAGASINPIDWKLRGGAFKAMMPLELPAILGRDAAGEVVEVGPGVTAFKVGQRVMGLVNRGYATLVVAPINAWAEVPPTLNLADAAALPLVLLTGAQLAEQAVDVREGDRLLVTGAAGGVGRAAVFAAKARGAIVYAGVRRAQKGKATELGADKVVALDDDGEVAQLPQVDSIADTVGGDTIKKLYGKIKPGGTIGTVVGEPPGAVARGLVVRGMMAHPDAKRLAELARAVAEGKLIIPIAHRFPLDEAREAQRTAEKGAGGKVILLG